MAPAQETLVAMDHEAPGALNYSLVESVTIEDNLKVTFFETEPAPDHGNRTTQTISGIVNAKSIINLAKSPPPDIGGESRFFYLPAKEMMTLAMNIQSKYAYKLKVTVGGQNIAKLQQDEPESSSSGSKSQDYFVSPYQEWIDGATVRNGVVRQMVALPPRTRRSIEFQLTKKEEIRDIEIEVFQRSGFYVILSLAGKRLVELHDLTEDSTIGDVKACIEESEHIPCERQILYSLGRLLESEKTLRDYNIKSGERISVKRRDDGSLTNETLDEHVVVSHKTDPSMVVAAGGLISQDVAKDLHPGLWDEQAIVKFAVKIVDFASFEDMTKLKPKFQTPINPPRIPTKAQGGDPYDPEPDMNYGLQSLAQMRNQEGRPFGGFQSPGPSPREPQDHMRPDGPPGSNESTPTATSPGLKENSSDQAPGSGAGASESFIEKIRRICCCSSC